MKMLRASVAAGAAFVVGSAGALCVGAMGLVVTAFAAWPLTLGLAALLAALAAVWVGNLGTPDRARLAPAVAVALGTAAAILAGGLALDAAMGGRFMAGGPLVLTLGACVAGVAAGSGASAALLRGPRGELGFGGEVSLVLAFCGLVCAYLVSPFGLSPLAGSFLLPYPVLAGGCAVVALAGVSVAVLWGRVPGREIGRDAALTLALAWAIVPVFAAILHAVCSRPGLCGA